jgi:Fic family protein
VPKYIYQYPQWPNFIWNETAIQALLGEVRHLQGQLFGRMQTFGFTVQQETLLKTITRDVLTSSEIEGELLDEAQVRSSIAKRLGISLVGQKKSSRHVEGVVDMMLDATQQYHKTITKKRLLTWHKMLFPTGYSGLYAIDVGKYRTEIMQIVSGAMGKEQLHYEAIPHQDVHHEMTRFITWCNKKQHIDPVVMAAVAHFWFIIIHPFDDGNGRIARAISDLFLCRADASPERYYSLSAQILVERKNYYAILQKVQHSEGDITPWMLWFLTCLKNALLHSLQTLDVVVEKTNFWQKHAITPLNQRQRTMINILFDGFEGSLKTSKWSKMMKCSLDTALRDINDLVEKGILVQQSAGGRSTNYLLLK